MPLIAKETEVVCVSVVMTRCVAVVTVDHPLLQHPWLHRWFLLPEPLRLTTRPTAASTTSNGNAIPQDFVKVSILMHLIAKTIGVEFAFVEIMKCVGALSWPRIVIRQWYPCPHLLFLRLCQLVLPRRRANVVYRVFKANARLREAVGTYTRMLLIAATVRVAFVFALKMKSVVVWSASRNLQRVN